MTKEQYSGQFRNKISPLSTSRDVLNPEINLETLKNRLWVTEHYRLLHGVEHAYWPHYFLRRAGNHLWKFKFAYAFKGILAYNVYRDVRNFQYRNSTQFLNTVEQQKLVLQVCYSGLVATAAFLYL